ncbi:VOC family virulence protein [Streptomyces adustus]|uniref:VOC family virulence protein n=1 Tax=Streptomyces adustus TaxID=1609272 RepID=A0A5N8V4I1_9ACTN|nr:VOC family virulence protein [Streptomyces adustus]
MPSLRVKAFDHLVLNVADVERSLSFYTGLLGLEAVRVDEWRQAQAPFPSVRITPETIIDLVAGTRGSANVDHICLTVDPLDWDEFIASAPCTVLEGPVPRFGARGTATSVYIQDPDGNGIELRWYPQDVDDRAEQGHAPRQPEGR